MLFNQTTGDGVFNFMQIELYLLYLGITKTNLANIFEAKESLTYKLKVKNRLAVKTNEEIGFIDSPPDLEAFLNSLYIKYQDYDLRIFIRPSGTEDVLRVHVEAKSKPQIEEIKQILDYYILNHIEINK